MTGHSTQNSVHGTVDWAWPLSGTRNPAPSPWWWVDILTSGDLRSQSGDNHAAWHMEAEVGSVKVARELVRSVTRDWGLGHATDDAELVISELLTNALRHAPVDAAALLPLHVAVLNRGAELVCAVRDHSDLLPAPREPDFMAETGRGLHLISSFSRRWGVAPVYPRGKFVWALLV